MNVPIVFKCNLTLFLLTLFICSSYGQDKTANIKTFSKIYGYVRFFHPSDEASEIDWNRFAIIGAKSVENCHSASELVDSLNALFNSIAPSCKIFSVSKPKYFNLNQLKPTDTAALKVVSWQHLGVDLGYKGLTKGSVGKVYKSVRVNRSDSTLFSEQSHIGDHINVKVSDSIQIIMPLALYSTSGHTFPEANSDLLRGLQTRLSIELDSTLKGNILYTRLGCLIIVWNVFQHFYPYLKMAKTDWSGDFQEALMDVYSDKSAQDFTITLKKMTKNLNDGHIRVLYTQDSAQYCPPFYWEWIQNKLVITKTIGDNTGLRVGDIITKIDNVKSKNYFDSVSNYISASTVQFLRFRSQIESVIGRDNSNLRLEINRGGKILQNEVKRNIHLTYYMPGALVSDRKIESISNDIVYLNLSTTSIDEIKDSLELFQKAKAIICDLRGYPKNNHKFLEYLIRTKDTGSNWLMIPKITQPDQIYQNGFEGKGWEIHPMKPMITAKIFCIMDGRCLSYAESVLTIMKNFHLAVLIGQPSGGTNGTINIIPLPGNYFVSWTGMLVKKSNTQMLHGVGILPDIYVQKSIQGVKQGKDEFLEIAMKLARKAAAQQ